MNLRLERTKTTASADDTATEVAKPSRGRSARFERLRQNYVAVALLTFGALLAVFPIAFTVVNSLKSRGEFASNRLGLPENATLENYIEALSRLNLWRLLWNSFVTTLGGVLVVTVVAAMAGYAVAKLDLPFRRTIFFVLVATLLIPTQTIMYPLFDAMQNLGLINTHHGLILAYGSFGLPLGVYFMAAYFSAIPDGVIEAAALDGASTWQTIWRVVVPISRPGLLALAALNMVWMWNELLLPLLLLPDPDLQTLMVGIAQFPSEYDISVPLMSAGSVVAMLPILVLGVAAQRYLAAGLAAGSGK